MRNSCHFTLPEQVSTRNCSKSRTTRRWRRRRRRLHLSRQHTRILEDLQLLRGVVLRKLGIERLPREPNEELDKA